MTTTARRAIILVAVAVVAVLGVIYAVFDPMETWWMPRCMFRVLTGFDCPGCGSQRAIHALLHGNLTAALRANAVMVISLPVVALYLFAEFSRSRHPRLFLALNSRAATLSVAALIVLWWIVRNLVPSLS
ncbi:MAG: DUF2752 domain-containing protein [Clostridium sp.]|nr:DUF2752 domain-containing protein [Clostridium sp.]